MKHRATNNALAQCKRERETRNKQKDMSRLQKQRKFIEYLTSNKKTTLFDQQYIGAHWNTEQGQGKTQRHYTRNKQTGNSKYKVTIKNLQ